MRRLAAGFGLIDFPFDTMDGFWRWVDLCEAEGADSIWFSDRMNGLAPALECLSALAAVAGRTRRIKFGSNVLSLALRDPVLVARQCATIDQMSGGRLLPVFGIGAGAESEWRGRGLDFSARGRRCDEALEILRQLWAGQTLEFSGTQFQYSGIAINPLPAQPELPMWIGGSGAAAIRRTAHFGTGWQGGIETPEQAGAIVAGIRAAAAERGRAIDEDHYGTTLFFRFGHPDEVSTMSAIAMLNQRFGFDLTSSILVGDADVILSKLSAFIHVGVSKFVLVPVAFGDADMLAQTRRAQRDVASAVAALLPRG